MCGEIFQANATVKKSYIVSVDMCAVCLDSKDFSEVEDMRERERERNTLPNGITRSQKREKKKSNFYQNPIMGLLSRAEH